MSFSQAIYGANYAIEEVNWGRRSITRSPNGFLHVVWPQRTVTQTSKYQVMYSCSADDGHTWDAATELTDEATDHLQISVTCDSQNNIYVFFRRNNLSGDPMGIWLRKYTEVDETWGVQIEVSTRDWYSPSYQRTSTDATVDKNGKLYVFYSGQHSIYPSEDDRIFRCLSRNSDDGGVTWSIEEEVTPEDRSTMKAYYSVSDMYWDFPIGDSDSLGNVHLNYNMRTSGGAYLRHYKRRSSDGVWSTWEEAMVDYPSPGPYYNQIIGSLTVDSQDNDYLVGHCQIPTIGPTFYNIRYKTRSNIGVWSVFINLTTETTFSYNVASIQFNTDDSFYVVYRKAVTLGLNYYRKYSDGIWGAQIDWTPADSATARSLTVSPNQRWPNRTCIAVHGFLCIYKRIDGSTNYMQFYNDWIFNIDSGDLAAESSINYIIGEYSSLQIEAEVIQQIITASVEDFDDD